MKAVYLLILLMLAPAAYPADQLSVIGWIEPVKLLQEDLILNAKIDTGADHSSIDIVEFTQISQHGKDSVRFTIRNNSGQIRELQKPVLRFARIKRKGAESTKRPVVQMEICLAGKVLTIPVNLQKRNHFKYRMLIGRSALKGQFLVNSAITSTSQPECGQ
jgi:hypothetical protein